MVANFNISRIIVKKKILVNAQGMYTLGLKNIEHYQEKSKYQMLFQTIKQLQ